MGTHRIYMKGNKLIENNKVGLTIEKSCENLRYDMHSVDGSYICSIYKFADGFIISFNRSKESAYAKANKDSILGLQYGTYNGIIGKNSLAVGRNTIKINNEIVATHSGTNAGYINAFLSAYTYKTHHIDISGNLTSEELAACVAIYAYLNYIR